MSRVIDVLGLGTLAADEVIFVDHYPPADSKSPVRQRERRLGGLCGAALVAAARLSARCAYAGVVGNDEASSFALRRLNDESVDTRHARHEHDAGIVQSWIIVDRSAGTRNIFYDLHQVRGPDPESLPLEAISRSAVLLVDHVGIEGMIAAAKTAREAGVAVVGDFDEDHDPRFIELLDLSDHLILSRSVAGRLTGMSDPTRAAMSLWRPHRQAVIVTAGAAGCWSVSGTGRAAEHHSAFVIEAVNTTGCGDVFHGAYAAALAQGLNLRERIRLSAACGAMRAARLGSGDGFPTRQAVETFLRERAS